MTDMKTLRRRLGERAFAAPEYPATSPAAPETGRLFHSL